MLTNVLDQTSSKPLKVSADRHPSTSGNTESRTRISPV
jgi:hypothetical protein